MALNSKDLQSYLEALNSAMESIDLARRLIPDPGLDHAIDRLRFLLLQGARLLPAEA
jgi:phosphatidylserine/phosphatidylglycerophosphate/cardiolipin synthase-like enzyme